MSEFDDLKKALRELTEAFYTALNVAIENFLLDFEQFRIAVVEVCEAFEKSANGSLPCANKKTLRPPRSLVRGYNYMPKTPKNLPYQKRVY